MVEFNKVPLCLLTSRLPRNLSKKYSTCQGLCLSRSFLLISIIQHFVSLVIVLFVVLLVLFFFCHPFPHSCLRNTFDRWHTMFNEISVLTNLFLQMFILCLVLPVFITTVQSVASPCPATTGLSSCPNGQFPGTGTCLQDIYGRNIQCTAKDSPVGVVYACVANQNGSISCDGSQITQCNQGSTNLFLLNLTVKANADRYDVGVYISPSGTTAATGSCCSYILSPTSTNIVNTTGGCGPFRNLDGDACGDIKANEVAYELIQVPLQCDGTSGQTLKAPFCTLWKQNSNNDCGGPQDLRPGTGSKCKCSLVEIGNVYVAGTITSAFLTGPTCYTNSANSLTYSLTATNGAATLSNVNVTIGGQLLTCCTGPGCTPNTQTIASWPTGGSLFCTYSINPAGTVQHVVSALVSGTDGGNNLVTATSNTVTTEYDHISVTQSLSIGTTLNPGISGLATFTLHIVNDGSSVTTVQIVNSESSLVSNCTSNMQVPTGPNGIICVSTYTPTACYARNTVSVTSSVCGASSGLLTACAYAPGRCISPCSGCIDGACLGPSDISCASISQIGTSDSQGQCVYKVHGTNLSILPSDAESCSSSQRKKKNSHITNR